MKLERMKALASKANRNDQIAGAKNNLGNSPSPQKSKTVVSDSSSSTSVNLSFKRTEQSNNANRLSEVEVTETEKVVVENSVQLLPSKLSQRDKREGLKNNEIISPSSTTDDRKESRDNSVLIEDHRKEDYNQAAKDRYDVSALLQDKVTLERIKQLQVNTQILVL